MIPAETRWKLGEPGPSVGLPKEYFTRRGIFLDCRGPLSIDATSSWGFSVVILTRSHDIGHDISGGDLGPVIDYPVTVEAGAWIGSNSLLAGCHIGKGAVVAAGTVVRGQNVAPGVMVAGNPARVIARWNGAAWVYVRAGECGYRRELR